MKKHSKTINAEVLAKWNAVTSTPGFDEDAFEREMFPDAPLPRPKEFSIFKPMSQAATISFHTDLSVKNQFSHLCEDFGLDVSSVLSLFVRAVLRERKIPFLIQASSPAASIYPVPPGEEHDPFWSAANQAHLREAVADLNAGKYVVHDTIEVDDA
jgi:DNA-damage-inducible protein J